MRIYAWASPREQEAGAGHTGQGRRSGLHFLSENFLSQRVPVAIASVNPLKKTSKSPNPQSFWAREGKSYVSSQREP